MDRGAFLFWPSKLPAVSHFIYLKTKNLNYKENDNGVNKEIFAYFSASLHLIATFYVYY